MALKEENGDTTPLRPSVPSGCRIYAIGDIHGRDDLLERLHRRIVGDAGTAPSRKLLVYLGDYVDRGLGTFAVIERLLNGLPGFEAVHLKGNHEDLLLQCLDDGANTTPWLEKGGNATLRSYGVDAADDPRRRMNEALPESHRTFLRELKISHAEGDYLFVHAGVKPGVPLDDQADFDLMWIRQEFLNSDVNFGKVIVHGHVPCQEPMVRANRIGIDTGAWMTGSLTCLVLEGETRWVLST